MTARIHVCPLSKLDETLAATGADSVVSLLSAVRRDGVPGVAAPARRLDLVFSDIVEAMDGHILAFAAHAEDLLRFVRLWDRERPLLIHCFAGVSRSTAAAFIAACALDPETPESEHATRLRTASPMATPNRRLVALADDALHRQGRMNGAIAAIGRGADCFEGVVFSLPVPPVGARASEMG